MRLTKEQKAEYQKKEPVAVYDLSNFGGIAILDIIYDTDDYIVWYNNQIESEKRKIHISKIYYTYSDSYFMIYGSKRIKLSECLRVA